MTRSIVAVAAAAVLTGPLAASRAGDYPVIDTSLTMCFDAVVEIPCPAPGEPFHGQDAQHAGTQPSFTLSSDGLTVYDNQTGLTWQHAPDTNDDGVVDSYDKLSWVEFQAHPATLNSQAFGGFDDWRVPTIKELYSLIDFSGIDPSGFTGSPEDLIPFIDTDYFAFAYGDEHLGERIIDAQYWSGTEYVGTVFGGEAAVFGVNFADGRIKGYPRDQGPGGIMTQFARYVRGNPEYGMNALVDNGDGTITDTATGLMWMQDDSGVGMIWEDALAHAESATHAGYDDWRLPNPKELQSIVDYTRSPTTTDSPAIDPLFTCTSIIDEADNLNYPFYWTSTTHINWTPAPGAYAAYVAFGQALGYFGPPGQEAWVDVHGAGAQRSDPKTGDPDDWPFGHGPQGDAIRIFNFVRCVRDSDLSSDQIDADPVTPPEQHLLATPSPAIGSATIRFDLGEATSGTLEIFDARGRLTRRLSNRTGTWLWDGIGYNGRRAGPGLYFVRLHTVHSTETTRLLLLR